MRTVPAFILGMALTIPFTAFAQEEADPLAEYLWLQRPLVIFADTPNDPRFKRQMELLEDTPEELELRDVIVVTDTDPDEDSALREKLHPRGFMLVVIGKDGKVAFRKPVPWSVRELIHAIDKIPMRQDEILESLGK